MGASRPAVGLVGAAAHDDFIRVVAAAGSSAQQRSHRPRSAYSRRMYITSSHTAASIARYGSNEADLDPNAA